MDQTECEGAWVELNKLGTSAFNHSSLRHLVAGTWNKIPTGCSVQYAGQFVSERCDSSPHWNRALESSNERLATGEFRAICRTEASGKEPPSKMKEVASLEGHLGIICGAAHGH